jgi:hypothetical protein
MRYNIYINKKRKREMKGFNANELFETKLANGDVVGAIDVAIAGAEVAIQLGQERRTEIEAVQAEMDRKVAEKLAKYRTL